MKKLKLFLSGSKILLTVALLLFSIISVGHGIFSRTGAFMNSALNVGSNRVAGDDWPVPEAPLFWVEEDSQSNKVSWLAVKNVVTYKIYRSQDQINYQEIAALDFKTSYIDKDVKAGTVYYYKVTSLDPFGYESDLTEILAKAAKPQTLVIDDDAMEQDYSMQLAGDGLVTASSNWVAHSVSNLIGPNQLSTAQAVGGDRYLSNNAVSDSFVWTTSQALNGIYELSVSYVCDNSKGIAEYELYSGAKSLSQQTIKVNQALNPNDGSPCDESSDLVSRSGWYSLGTFAIEEVAELRLVASSGTVEADALAFDKISDINLEINAYVCPAGTIITDQQRPNFEGQAIIPEGCEPEKDQDFAYAYQSYQRDLNPPYPLYTLDASLFKIFPQTTDDSGQLLIGGLSSQGRYFLTEVDEQAHQLAESKVLGLLCSSDQTNYLANYELALIPETGREYCNVYNVSPLASTLTIANSPAKDMEERVLNGGFENGLEAWSVKGIFELVENSNDSVASYEGDQVLRLGGEAGQETVLSQNLDNSRHGLRSLSFWYLLGNPENAEANEPILVVYANDKMLYQLRASDLSSAEVSSNSWQQVTVYLADISDANLEINFSAAQTPVYLDEISTNSTVVNSNSKFKIESVDLEAAPNTAYRYYVNGYLKQGYLASGSEFSIWGQPDNQEIEYWAVAKNGRQGEKNIVEIIYDNQAPLTITDLKAYDEKDGNYSLSFTAPEDNPSNPVRAYDIRYSLEPITELTDWESLAKAPVQSNNSPLAAGQKELINIVGLEADLAYYFAVKVIDVAGNKSILSNVAQVADLSNNETYLDSPVVINEIMYDPLGDDEQMMPNGEWTELYNNAEEALDLNNWLIIDESGKEMLITKDNSDNNLNLLDEGETVIPAKGYLVVYRNSKLMPDFDNDGDTVSFYNPDGDLANSYMYQGGVPEGKTEARVIDGAEEWSLESIATPGRANVQTLSDLEPQVRFWQQEPFNLMISIFDAVAYQRAEYELEYIHMVDGNELVEVRQNAIEIDSNWVNQTNIYLATCSSGGTCTPHLGMTAESFKLRVTLKGEGLKDKVIEADLTGPWEEPAPSQEEISNE
jgi:hypothetical protein